MFSIAKFYVSLAKILFFFEKRKHFLKKIFFKMSDFPISYVYRVLRL